MGYTQHNQLRVDYDNDPDPDTINPEIPQHAVPVDILDKTYIWSIIKGWKPHSTTYSSEGMGATTVVTQVPHLETWEKMLLQHLQVHDKTEETIWHKLTTSKCYIATDGSAPSGKGSFAWVISDDEG
jgi:hypothetical protein